MVLIFAFIPKNLWLSFTIFYRQKEHGVAMRKVALAKGLHLNEWGIFDKNQNKVAGSTEEDVYHALDLEWIPPEIRENTGEIELAKTGGKELPYLIQYNDLRGDLQVHSDSTRWYKCQ